MVGGERIFKREYAPELLRIAEADLDAAKALEAASGIRRETVLFHVEQAVEKALKAALCWRGSSIPLTHDLYAIVQRFPANDLPPGGYQLHDLTPFATIRRHEEGVAVITPEDVRAAFSAAEAVLRWAKAEVSGG